MEEVMNVFTAALLGEDMALLQKMVEPMLPVIAQLFGSDIPTITLFMETLLSKAGMRKTMADLIAAFHTIAALGEEGLPKILELLDNMIGSVLIHFMHTYKKPIVSTTFMEFPQALKGASYPYTTSAKAVRVLARLVEYREYLEHHGAFVDPMQVCALLSPEYADDEKGNQRVRAQKSE
jgi:hypothetical protein